MRILPVAFLTVACLVPVFASAQGAAPTLVDLENAYEMRIQKIYRTKGSRAVAELLEHDAGEQPKPYMKAWFAAYLLFGDSLGVPEMMDHPRGFALAKESMAAGSPLGTALVGMAYGDARGPGFRDSKKAAGYLQQAAELGSPLAMAELAEYHFFGRPGVAQDRALAEQWARKGAWGGWVQGLSRLAGWWENPKYSDPVDREKAMALHYEAALLGMPKTRELIRERAAAGVGVAVKYANLLYVVDWWEGALGYPVKIKAAVKWLRENTPPEDHRVHVAVAELMIEKLGPVYDAKGARAMLEKAAAAGSDDAREILALMAFRGIGQKADPAAAIAVWRELAEKGNARALHAYGRLHWWDGGEKYGVPKDAAKAYELCRRAADLGYWRALPTMAECYVHGVGTEMNYHLAAKYYDLLAIRGYIDGREKLQRTLAHLRD